MPTQFTERTSLQTISGAEEAQFISLENGNIAVVWSADDNTGAASSPGVDILIQIFDPLGQSLGEPVLAAPASGNDYANNQNFSAVARGNEIIIAYESDSEFGTAIRATELFTGLDGAVAMNGTVVVAGPNFATPNSDPVVSFSEASGSTSGLDNGDVFAVTYNQSAGNGDNRIVQNTVETGGDGPVSAPVTVATALVGVSDGIDTDIAAATLTNGNIVYIGNSGAAIGDTLVLNMTDAYGTPTMLSTVVANTFGSGREDQAEVTALDGGGFVVAWRTVDTSGSSDLLFQRYNAAGTPEGFTAYMETSPSNFDVSEPTIAALNGGGFVATWVVEAAGVPNSIYARVFDSTGNPVAGEVLVHHTVNDLSELNLEVLPDGRVVVSWTADTLFSENTEYKIFDTEVEVIFGRSDQDDVLVALEEASTVFGDDPVSTNDEGGRDLLFATGEGDTLYGGHGDDTLVSGEGEDYLDGGEGFDIVSYEQSDQRVRVILTENGQVAESLLVRGGFAEGDRLFNVEGLIGSQFQDLLVGRENGESRVFGLGGDDQLWAHGGGNDIFGGEGNDTIADRFGVGGAHTLTDYFYGSEGDDTFSLGSGENYAYGDRDDDTFIVRSATSPNQAGGERIIFTSTNNIRGGTGVDTLKFGEFGFDAGVNVNLVVGRVVREHGTDFVTGIENVTGTDADDIIIGDRADNVLIGKDGDDLLIGAGGDDTLRGGDGENTMSGGNDDDRLYGGDDDDIIKGDSGNDLLVGAEGDDSLSGGSGDDTLYGNSGEDVLNGGANDDVLYGGDGDDTLRGEAGRNILSGGGDNDRLYGGDEDDILNGDSGDDLLVGADGDDTLNGGSGDDRLYGNSGEDRLNGEAGEDWISGGNGADVVMGREGDDTLRGGNQNDRMFGGEDNDLIAGNTGDDTLEGGSGDDRLFGGADNDRIVGGADTDVMTGGSGADVFVFNYVADSEHGAGRDTITDFVSGTDQIDLSGFATPLTFIGTADYSGAAGEVRYNESVNRLYINEDGGDGSDFSIDLTGVTNLSETDLIL